MSGTKRGSEPTEANNSVWDIKSSSAAEASALLYLPTLPALPLSWGGAGRGGPGPTEPWMGEEGSKVGYMAHTSDPTSATTSSCGPAPEIREPHSPTFWKGS